MLGVIATGGIILLLIIAVGFESLVIILLDVAEGNSRTERVVIYVE